MKLSNSRIRIKIAFGGIFVGLMILFLSCQTLKNQFLNATKERDKLVEELTTRISDMEAKIHYVSILLCVYSVQMCSHPCHNFLIEEGFPVCAYLHTFF